MLGVVPFDKHWQRQTDLAQDLHGDEAHPPSRVTNVHSPMQPWRLAQAGESEVVLFVDAAHGSERPLHRVDLFPEAVEGGRVVNIEHVSADDRRAPGERGEAYGSDDALWLNRDVVVEHHVERARSSSQRFVHTAGEAPRSPKVGLSDDTQLRPQRLRSRIPARLLLDGLSALVDDIELVQVLTHLVSTRDGSHNLAHVLGLVDRCHPDREAGLTLGFAEDQPLSRGQNRWLPSGDDVEPVPPSVDEGNKVEVNFNDGRLGPLAGMVRRRCASREAVQPNRGAAGVGPVDQDRGFALDCDSQPHPFSGRPSAPV